jgi:hypothetical protein
LVIDPVLLDAEDPPTEVVPVIDTDRLSDKALSGLKDVET